MRSKLIWGVAALLFVLHQDCWNWDDGSLLFGFLPVGLAYHAGFSLAAAALWLAAIRFAWPSHIEAWAEAGEESAAPGRETPPAKDYKMT